MLFATIGLAMQAQVTADFRATDSTLCFKPYQLGFWETSTSTAGNIVAWHWDYGDGNTSSVRFNQHTYQNPGVYDVTLIVTDALGNKDTLLKPGYITISPPIFITDTITHATCNNNGAINITPTGGTPPYTFDWSTNPQQHTEDLANLSPRTYYFLLEDAAECYAYGTYVVADRSVVRFNVNITGAGCLGTPNGALEVTNITGGQPPYQYSLDNATYSSNPLFPNLVSGWYGVYVKDANGCIASDSVSITTPAGPISVRVDSSSCNWPSGGWGVPYDAAIHITKNQIADHLKFSLDGQPFVTDTVFTALYAGMHTLQVQDTVSGCITSQEVNVGYLNAINLNVAPTFPSCNSCQDGSAILTVSGGTPPYNYLWSNGSTAQNMTRLMPGIYRVTVVDANGCVAEGEAILYDHCPMQVSFPYPTLGCWGGEVDLGATVTDGLPPYTYQWHDGSTDSVLHVTVNTQCYVTVTDAEGCVKSASVYVEIVPPPPVFFVRVYDTRYICPGDSVQLNINANFSIDAIWSPKYAITDTQGLSISAFPDTTTVYTAQVRYQSGCVQPMDVGVIIDTACVWPGDANYDGIVDNNDILSIGVYYGLGGGSRVDTGTVWAPAACADVEIPQANGADRKHVNTNGWSNINADDTLAVSLNYSLTHLKTSEQRKDNHPDLFIDMPDTATAGETVYAPIYLGSTATPVQNVYGIKFSVQYDNALVDSNSIHLDISQSWMGTPGVDLLGFTKDLYSLGRADFAITRTNQVSVDGGGPIGLLSFTMKDDVSGKDLLAIPMAVDLLGVRAIDELENELTLTTSGDTVIVTQEIGTGINTLLAGEVTVYPNPANGLLHIATTGLQILQANMVNILGQEISPTVVASEANHRAWDVSMLPRGIYILHLSTPKGRVAHRVVLH